MSAMLTMSHTVRKYFRGTDVLWVGTVSLRERHDGQSRSEMMMPDASTPRILLLTLFSEFFNSRFARGELKYWTSKSKRSRQVTMQVLENFELCEVHSGFTDKNLAILTRIHKRFLHLFLVETVGLIGGGEDKV